MSITGNRYLFQITKIMCLVAIPLFFNGCKPEDDVISKIPVISLEGITTDKDVLGRDSAIHIIINYTDGDGNIGLGPNDTLPPFNPGSVYSHNLPIEIYTNTTGSFELLLDPNTSEPLVLHERVPILEPEGKNKTITGSFTVNLPAKPLNLEPTQMKFIIKLIDRDLNISNVIETEAIDLKH